MFLSLLAFRGRRGHPTRLPDGPAARRGRTNAKSCLSPIRLLSTGDQCGRDTPDENIRAMIETARTYGEY